MLCWERARPTRNSLLQLAAMPHNAHTREQQGNGGYGARGPAFMYMHTRHFIILKYGGARTMGTADWLLGASAQARLRAINFILFPVFPFFPRRCARQGASIDLNTVLMYTHRGIFANSTFFHVKKAWLFSTKYRLLRRALCTKAARKTNEYIKIPCFI